MTAGKTPRVVVIGAGMGGLAAAIDLAASGLDVSVVEKEAAPGGKMREVLVAGRPIDSGPTVLTMRPVFEALFAEAGASLEEAIRLRPLDVLARHAWSGDATLDLFGDLERSADAVGTFAGAREAQGYREFAARAERIHATLAPAYIHASRPALAELVMRVGPHRLGALRGISPFTTLWRALGEHFRDPRLRQLFGRYATYCGSSPFLAPATLMLVAHVERMGVWVVEGGLQRLAEAMAGLAGRLGATLRFGQEVAEIVVERGAARGVVLRSGERIEADAVVSAADVAGLPLLGRGAAAADPPVAPGDASLSALTWSMVAETSGFPLAHHSVFFCDDYTAEFDDIRGGRPPRDPTVYVCAQDRGPGRPGPTGPERLFFIVNAPADGGRHTCDPTERQRCEERLFRRLDRCGLRLRPESAVATTPSDFDRLFPGTRGALYGRASHGWTASFQRPGSRSRVPRLYLAGGSVHPGPGVPMAAISGRLAAASVVRDLASTRRSRRAATPGGTSTR